MFLMYRWVETALFILNTVALIWYIEIYAVIWLTNYVNEYILVFKQYL